MSYPNLVMLFKTIPSFDSEETSPKKETNGAQNDESIDVSEIGDYINKRRSENMAFRNKKKR